MVENPDFFLSAAGENDDLSDPRACWRRQRLRDDVRDDYLLVDIAPNIPGQKYGLGDKDITELILATRHQGVTLFPVTEWPAHVYAFRILDRTFLKQAVFEAHQVEMIAWGIIYRSPAELVNCDGAESIDEA
jgi:hypothetical protein